MKSNPAPFQLTPQDKASAVWPKLLDFMKQQRETLRRTNDGPLSEMETAGVRGQIKQLSLLIDMDKDRPTPTVGTQF
jgi:hypothetical protein